MRNLLKFLTKIARHKTFLVLALVLVGLVIVPDLALAEETTDKLDDIKQNIAGTATIIFAFLNALLYPMLVIVGALMDNEVLIGPEMESTLLGIWVEIRNWVNITFVLVLVGVALYNVAGISGEGSNYALKSILPKIVIGLIAVNFSFLAVKLLIDSVAVLTDAVYALPTNFIQWDDEKDELTKRLCSHATVADDGSIVVDSPRAVSKAPLLSSMMCKKAEDGVLFAHDPEPELNDLGKSFYNNFGEHNVVAVMMVNMGMMADINVLDEDSNIDALSQITLSVLFGIFMFIMFGFAYVALIIVLLGRLIILWICLALSPIIVLFFVFPDVSNNLGGDMNLKEKFWGNLLAPLIIGVVFSIGFTMISILKASSSGSWMGKIAKMDISDFEDVNEIGTTLGKDITDFQSLLVAIAAVLIIWMGVFGAAEKTVANSITGKIKDAGQTVGKFVAKLPLYATAIPIPGTTDPETGKEQKFSLMSAFKLPRLLSSDLDTKSRGGAQAMMEKAGFGVSGASKGLTNTMGEMDRAAAGSDKESKLYNYLVGTPGAVGADLGDAINKLDNKKNIRDYMESNNISDSDIGEKLKNDQAFFDLVFEDMKRENKFPGGTPTARNEIGKADHSTTAQNTAAAAGATAAAGTTAAGATADPAVPPPPSTLSARGAILDGDEHAQDRGRINGALSSGNEVNLQSVFTGGTSGDGIQDPQFQEMVQKFQDIQGRPEDREAILSKIEVNADGKVDIDHFVDVMQSSTGGAADDPEGGGDPLAVT